MYASVFFNCYNTIICFFQNDRLIIVCIKFADEFTIAIKLNTHISNSIFAAIMMSDADEVSVVFLRKKCTCNNFEVNNFAEFY